MVVDNIHVVSV